MDTGSVEDSWSAERRDFVADSRDEAADARDIAGDARDMVAGHRDGVADGREAQLNLREEQLNLPEEQLAVRARHMSLSARALAEEDRAEANRDREAAGAGRDAAAERRVRGAQPTLLARAFASIAEQLYDADTYDEVITRIAHAAVATVAGGQMASVTLWEDGTYRTAGATDVEAIAVDQDQYDAGEGPTLDAIAMPLVDAPGFPDDRWPALGARPTAHGVESSLAYRLNTDLGSPNRGKGTLNIYGSEPAAFDQAAREVGFILAAHAALAARAVGERNTLEGLARRLEQALLARDVIGQAKGILMERLKVTPEDAFDILRSASQRLNVKLRLVALEMTRTGETAGTEPKES